MSLKESDVLSTPMFELISVCVHCRNNESLIDLEKPCRIFGRIWATNAYGDTFELYNREEGNPEFVNWNDSLSLPGPKPSVVVPSSLLIVNIRLKDSIHGIEIANGRYCIDYRNSFYEKEGVERVEGKDGAYALLQYATFPFAVIARVEVLYFSKDHYDVRPRKTSIDINDSDYSDYDDTDCGGCKDSIVHDVSGTVVATIKNQFRNSDESKSFFSIMVLNKPPKQRIKVKSGTFFELDRCVFAVPSYSRLKICINLSDRDSVLISGFADFKPHHDNIVFKKDIVGENGRIRVRVHWDNGYKLLNSGKNLKRMSEGESTGGTTNETEGPDKIQQPHSNPSSSAVGFSGSMSRVLPTFEERPLPLAEVFSVAVFSNDRVSCVVHGKITVHDAFPFPIFNKDESCPHACYQFTTLVPVASFSHCFCALDGFAIGSYLKDENGGIISAACASWNPNTIMKYYDKRICSVLRGKTGFAIVHYSVFRDGIQCIVKVLLYENAPGNSCTKVCGKLMAQYGNCSYSSNSTSYDQQYYRSTLFEGDVVLERDCCNLSESEMSVVSNVPLLKSVVSGPRKSSLVIQADLTATDVASSLFGAVGGNLQGTLVFNEGDSELEQEINMGKYRLSISVRWVHDF